LKSQAGETSNQPLYTGTHKKRLLQMPGTTMRNPRVAVHGATRRSKGAKCGDCSVVSTKKENCHEKRRKSNVARHAKERDPGMNFAHRGVHRSAARKKNSKKKKEEDKPETGMNGEARGGRQTTSKGGGK